jgi:hypothetical protein
MWVAIACAVQRLAVRLNGLVLMLDNLSNDEVMVLQFLSHD